ncbi:MAG: methyltransferase domain-containing protein [Acidimicrobiales bacterium]|nr:methyltransferase domain-containing protein [Acidimicrobiales bacterium]
MTTTLKKSNEHTEDATPVWVEAGRAWEHAAKDWAYLFEPYARDAIEYVFAKANVDEHSSVLDVACGSGLALSRAARLGASTAGLDAAEGLIDIARRRDRNGDLRVGDMFDLPWPDASFDLVTSFNGIWGGCAAAVVEMARVVKPGGMVALTFWGPGKNLDLRDFFIALGSAVPAVGEELIDLAEIGKPGVAEDMLASARLRLVERGSTAARFEWPDSDVAWRALRSPGVSQPPLEILGDAKLRDIVLTSIAPFEASDGSYQMTNELTHVIAMRPA